MTQGRTRLARRVQLKDKHIVTRMMDIAAGLPDVIKLGRGDPDLDTPAHIVRAGQEALASGATHYTHPQDLPDVETQALAAVRRRSMVYALLIPAHEDIEAHASHVAATRE